MDFSPKYNRSYSGQLKNLIDWLSRPEEGVSGTVIRGLPVAIAGITPGMSATMPMQEKLSLLLLAVGAKLLNGAQVMIAAGDKMVAGDELVLAENHVKRLSQQWQALTDFIVKQ